MNKTNSWGELKIIMHENTVWTKLRFSKDCGMYFGKMWRSFHHVVHAEITTWMLICLNIQIPIIMCSCIYIILKIVFRTAQGLEACAVGLESDSLNWLEISCFKKVLNHELRFSHLHHGGKKVLGTGEQPSAKRFSRFFRCCRFWALPQETGSNAGSILMLEWSCSPLWNCSCAVCLEGSNL